MSTRKNKADRWLLTLACALSVHSRAADLAVRKAADRLVITDAARPVAEFVFKDDRILRPYFANLHSPGGARITRTHPPVAGVDATDHDTMHPGVWLAFGDISGHDFWRNKGRIEHIRFIGPARVENGRLKFTTECRLRTAEGKTVCSVTNRLVLASIENAWLLAWEASFRSDEADFTFGDQEEMGFGVRVATPITEKNGGLIVNSSGSKSAKDTWGQPAEWCDYSARPNGKAVGGIMVMAHPANFRPSWWHNRDYGLMVANPFGRDAMKQGPRSSITVQRGETFRLCFGAVVHEGGTQKLDTFYKAFQEQMAISDKL